MRIPTSPISKRLSIPQHQDVWLRQARLGEPEKGAAQSWLKHYRALIDLRKAEIVPRLSGQNGFAGQFELLGVKSVLVTWRMGDGSILRLYANLAEETQEEVPPRLADGYFCRGLSRKVAWVLGRFFGPSMPRSHFVDSGQVSRCCDRPS